MRYRKTNSPIWILLNLAFLFAGCVTTETVRPDNYQDENKDLLVTTLNGRRVKFYAGHYQVLGTDSMRTLIGKGEQWTGDDYSARNEFDGAISFREIAQIQTAEKTLFYYTGPILFGAAAVIYGLLVFFIMVVAKGRGLGG